MTLTPEMVEIAPCPFCGKAGKHIHRPSSITKWQRQVECSSTTCGASGPFEASRADAIRAWNARAQSQRAVGVEELEALVRKWQTSGLRGYSGMTQDACANDLRALIERAGGGAQ